ncbi:MAG: homoserine dehydrogenase [Candidatus Hadarchaeales archaeon]
MRIILIGFGNLGRGLARIFIKKAAALRKIGIIAKVVAAVDEKGAAVDSNGLELRRLLSVAEQRGTVAAYSHGQKGMLANQVLDEVEADVVFELTPTNIKTGEPGITHIKRAMMAGRHVITSNKGPLVVAFRELESLSRKCGVEFRYSASVGGAVPVIGLAKKLLSSNEITEIRGVLNGTTNYILSRMTSEEVPFEMVLREAQEMGAAEKDPSLDIKGIDTACKLTILANSILGLSATLKDVNITGIERISLEAIRLAKESGRTIKLIGIARKDRLEVAPKLIQFGHPLAVGGTLNSVTYKLDLAREITISGYGAGPQETSSSLLSDLIDIHRSLE